MKPDYERALHEALEREKKLEGEIEKYQKALDIAKEYIIHEELFGTARQRIDMIKQALKEKQK